MGMTKEDMVKIFNSLPPEAQQQVMDFVAFLKQRYKVSSKKKSNPDLQEQTFIGMWRDRPDMQDTRKWIRETRQGEWE
jgi:hypothetical protein